MIDRYDKSKKINAGGVQELKWGVWKWKWIKSGLRQVQGVLGFKDGSVYMGHGYLEQVMGSRDKQ